MPTIILTIEFTIPIESIKKLPNMRYFFLLLFSVTLSCYSQNKPIEIVLQTDSIIKTEWIQLRYFPFLQRPFIRIDNPMGQKIKIKNIKSYKGYDQHNNYRQLDIIDLQSQKKYSFTERCFRVETSNEIKIYHNQHTFGIGDRYGKIQNTKYSINNSRAKKLNLKNVKADIIEIDGTYTKLKKVNQLKALQYISFGIGVALISDVLLNNWNPNHQKYTNRRSTINLIASGVFLTFPFTLEKPKQQQLIKALKN